jgi:hypothetical protein
VPDPNPLLGVRARPKTCWGRCHRVGEVVTYRLPYSDRILGDAALKGAGLEPEWTAVLTSVYLWEIDLHHKYEPGDSACIQA